jgi:hypothetical protein
MQIKGGEGKISVADDRTARIFSMAVANELHSGAVILTNSEINLSAVCSISKRPKRNHSAYRSSRRRESLGES